MGQPIVVVEKPSLANPGMVRFETNRALTGMGHERYPPGPTATATARPTSSPGACSTTAGSAGVHINGNVITVDLEKGYTTDGMREIIEDLYIYYRRRGVEPNRPP